MLGDSKYETISLVAPVLYKLIYVILKLGGKDSTLLKAITNAICTGLNSQYKSLEVLRFLNTAAFLDLKFEQLDPFVAEADCEDVVKQVFTAVYLIVIRTIKIMKLY